MEKILLVEPNYKNKYPPIGLMKISTYYKKKGDYVQFHKGLLPVVDVRNFDKVLITTLFTFDFKMCIETIRYYIAIKGLDNVYVGGIAATIMPEKFKDAIPGINLTEGQLISSKKLGYLDEVNIDILELDYDILWDISYNYPASNSYFIYTSRGCPRKCAFCAVKQLEPLFYECQNVYEQINKVDLRFGRKKNLLVMDNNVLFAPHLKETIKMLVDLGFGVDNNKIKKSNEFSFMMKSLDNRLTEGRPYDCLLFRIKEKLINIKMRRVASKDLQLINTIQNFIKEGNDDNLLQYLIEQRNILEDFFAKYNFHKVSRYVDFNQGLDARLFTKEKANLLSLVALKPCRIAFDDIKTEEEYFRAMRLAVESGIKHFSNYLLYNFEDKPEDLWNRLVKNIEFYEENAGIRSLFSFPMKYASIVHTDRSYIGVNWNKKFLKSINVILNVTSGVVAKEKEFFLEAFGENEKRFIEILAMPDDYIRYRKYFNDIGLIKKWTTLYRGLKDNLREELLMLLSNVRNEVNVMDYKHNKELDEILFFYTVKKRNLEDNIEYYQRIFGVLK